MTEQVDTLASEEREKLNGVWKSYGKWFLGLAMLAVMASGLAVCANVYWSLSSLTIRIIQILSVVVEGTALGQGGHRIMTWGGESSAEKWDGRLFVIFSALGLSLIIFSFQLEPSQLGV